MLTNAYKGLLFISSFLPLYIILMVQFTDFDKSLKSNLVDHKIAYSVLTGLIVISIISFLYFLFCKMNKEESFGSVESANSEILSYFITYIVPLTTLKENDINSIIVNLILFVVMGVFYVSENQFYLNVLFKFTGFNVYQDENKKIIISKKNSNDISNKPHVQVKQVGNNIFLINKK
ncbi:hypothetical protein ACOSZE_09330 [Lysinibacillus fusiformis]|uniref:hypothetical protein n=1 Tax=Lysinibacillus fusiformis TaxID=28031 RepID=UPI003BA0EF7B